MTELSACVNQPFIQLRCTNDTFKFYLHDDIYDNSYATITMHQTLQGHLPHDSYIPVTSVTGSSSETFCNMFSNIRTATGKHPGDFRYHPHSTYNSNSKLHIQWNLSYPDLGISQISTGDIEIGEKDMVKKILLFMIIYLGPVTYVRY